MPRASFLRWPAGSLAERVIELRNVEEADLDALYENQSDPVAAAMAFFGGARERDAFLAHWTKILADPEAVARVVVLDGRLAGDIVSWKRDGRRFVGYWINRELWGEVLPRRPCG